VWKSAKEAKYTISSAIHVFYLRIVLDFSQKINLIVLNNAIIMSESWQKEVKQFNIVQEIAWKWATRLMSLGAIAMINAPHILFQIIIIINVW